jgi:hypothetical protein
MVLKAWEPGRRVREIALLAEPRDLWVGLSWDFARRGRMWLLKVYVCIVPCLPVRLTFGWRR